MLTKKMAHDNGDDNAAAAPPNRDGGDDGAAATSNSQAVSMDVQAVATMYDNMADEYLQMMQADAQNESAIGPTRAALKKLCAKTTASAPVQKGTLVDVGCGPGTNLVWLVKESTAVDLLASYPALIGIDLSPAMIRLAQKEALSQGLLPQERISFRVGNMLDLDSISPSSVAAMCNLCCIQHVHAEGLRKTLVEACRVLLPGGMLLLQFWTGNDAPLPGPAEDGAAFIGWKPETVRAILAEATQGRLVVEEQSRHVYPEFDMPYAFFYIRKK